MHLMIGILVTVLFSCASADPTTDHLNNWIVANRTELDSLTSEAAKAKIRKFLSDKLANKRFVHIGEPEHYIHEKWQYRELIMSALFEMGFTNILNEMGYSDSKAVNAYLQTGDEAHLRNVCLYGTCDSLNSEPTVYASEEIRFYKSLRQVAIKSDVQISQYGWDIDASPYFFYDNIVKDFEAIKGPKTDKVIQSIISRLQRPKDSSMALDSARAFAALEIFNLNKKVLEPALGKKRYTELYWDLRAVSDSLQTVGQFVQTTVALQKNPKDEQAKKDFYQLFIMREPAAWDRAKQVIQSLPSEQKFIVLGHNSHMSKHVAGATISYMDIIDNLPMWRSIGELISMNFPGETYVIWLGAGEGEYGTETEPCYGKICPAPPVAGTIEENFIKISNLPWIVSLKNALLSSQTYYSAQMKDKEYGDLKKAADAYFFIPRTTKMVR